MKPVSYYITISGCIVLIALGVYLSSWASSSYLWKMDAARALLSNIQSTSDPNSIESDIQATKTLLPEDGNPVWLSPTQDTDFGLIQQDMQTMLQTANNIAGLSPDDSTFHSGMLNIHAQASTITFNLIDAESNVWISPAFLLANSLWMVGVAGMWKIATRYRKEK
jgi:hypothetical protein